jgi:hypothetical protein
LLAARLRIVLNSASLEKAESGHEREESDENSPPTISAIGSGRRRSKCDATGIAADLHDQRRRDLLR